MVGTGLGAMNGVLRKNASAVENSTQLTVVVFGKTGTLAIGRKATIAKLLNRGVKRAMMTGKNHATAERIGKDFGTNTVLAVVAINALMPNPRCMGTTLEHIRISVPGLQAWLQKVFTAIGGFMVAAGVLTVFVATASIPLRLKGTAWIVGTAGALTASLMSASNFALHSDFRWLLLLPALVWLAGLVAYLANRGAPAIGHGRGTGGAN